VSRFNVHAVGRYGPTRPDVDKLSPRTWLSPGLRWDHLANFRAARRCPGSALLRTGRQWGKRLIPPVRFPRTCGLVVPLGQGLPHAFFGPLGLLYKFSQFF
jgi:hypothetical protein